MTEQTPEQRAALAAEALAAEGSPVTARSVRERAGVRMAVAAAAARAWSEREAATGEAPEIPDAVAARFDAIWREAYALARQAFDAERAGWAKQLKDAEAERNALADDVDRAEAERDEARAAERAAMARLATETSALKEELERERTRATEAAERAAREINEARDAQRDAEKAQAIAEAHAAKAEGTAAGLREALATLPPAKGS